MSCARDVGKVQRFCALLEPCALALVPVALFGCAALALESTALLSLIVLVVSFIPFIVHIEQTGLSPRELMPMVVLAAVAVAGRIIFAPFPNVKPVTAICIIAGISFGKRCGFMTGALAAFLSNIFFGQGPWTPWQMYAWGLTGYLSGVLFSREHQATLPQRRTVLIWGALAVVLYGIVMDSWYVVSFVRPLTLPAVLLAYAAGAFSTGIHLVATVLFLAVLYGPWTSKLARIQRVWGL